MKKFVLGLSFVGLGFLAACGGGDNAASGSGDGGNGDAEVEVVTIGVTGAFQDQWDVVNEILEPENIRVELVTFNDFQTPNPALADGETDLNAFQNIGFLNNAIEENGFEFEILGNTFISPLNIFPNQDRVQSVEDLGEGARVGIPSDLTNGGRALKLLEAAGLIVVDPEVGFLGTEQDIIENPSGIVIVPAESGMLAGMLPDLDAAVINAGNAITGGLYPISEFSIFEEDALNLEITDHLVNVIVARAEDADNPAFAKIVEAYQTQAVADVFADTFGGAFIPAWDR